MKPEIESKTRAYILFGKYLTGVVHSIRSKLMAVYGVTELILRDGDSTSRDHAQLQQTALSQILEMLDRYVFFVKTEELPLVDTIDINAAAASSIEIFRSGVAARIGIQIRFKPSGQVFIKGSPDDVFLIFEHVLQNAIEAVSNRKERVIQVRIIVEPPFARVDVVDSGAGLPGCISCRDSVCLECPRFAIGKSSKKNGNGLGMVWVQEGLLRIKGKLSIQSLPDTGTTVSLFFPVISRTE